MSTEITLSTKFYEVLQTHLETGVPVHDLNLSEREQKRIVVCMDAYKWLEEHPFSDVTVFLRNKHGRTMSEIKRDKETINYIVAQLEGDTKEMSRYRARKGIEKSMAASDAAGDYKTLIEGSKALIRLESLDKPESALEDLSKNVYAPPPVYTPDVSKINSDFTPITPEEKEKLFIKYNVKKDKTQEMVEAKMGFFIPAGTTMPYDDYEVADEYDDENFDEDEV